MELIHCVYMASTENVMFHGSRWSKPIDARATCGRWKFLSKYTTAAFAEPWLDGPPHTNGMLAVSIAKVRTRPVVPPLPVAPAAQISGLVAQMASVVGCTGTSISYRKGARVSSAVVSLNCQVP